MSSFALASPSLRAVEDLSAETKAAVSQPTADQVAFFEKHIRPVLVEHCYQCHSPRAPKLQGGLRLDTREKLRRGGDSGPVFAAGAPGKSLLIQAIRHDGLEMPPDKRLPDRIIVNFEKWVAMGAPDPRTGGARAGKLPHERAGRDHWAFQPIQRPSIPTVPETDWATSDIDRFILARLSTKGITPAKDADRYTWLRRVSFDLTGLPPTLEEMVDFVADEAPTAYHKVVDRLLGSRAFGERWSRYWLDLVGYADQRTAEAPMYAHHAWRYRDFVIDAFNNDVPFDHFTRQQLAGDLMPYKSIQERRDNLIATGFLVLGDMRISDYDKMQLHVDSTSTLYRATVGIWSEVNDIELPETPEQMARRIKAENEHARKLIRLNAELDQHHKRMEQLNELLEEDDDKRKRKEEAKQAEEREAKKKVAEQEKTDNNQEQDPLEQLRAERGKLAGTIPQLQHVINHAQLFISKIPLTYGVRDVPQPSDMRITIRGNPRALGAAVPRGVLAVLPTSAAPIPAGQSGRMQLAEWLASPDNPLTPRVTVNRIWQKMIGVGLHQNVDYYGLPEGEPSHPELLDYLASSFVQNGWSQKTLIRSIALSRTYQMGSHHNPQAHQIDPTNQLIWRMNRSRMDAEALRDALLAASGKLKPFAGGPTFPFDIPGNVVNIGKIRSIVNPPFFRLTTFHPETEFYRTVYLPIIRGPLQPAMADLRNVFDFTSPAQTAGQRNVTTVPTQALYLMNSPQVKQYAQHIAERIQSEAEQAQDRVRRLWLVVLNRPATEQEESRAAEFLGQAGEDAWRELCHALIVSGEFLMRI